MGAKFLIALDGIILALAIAIGFPIAALGLELLLSLFARDNAKVSAIAERPACAVLIPAHNEEMGIRQTVESVKKQLRAGDRIVVVADNCTDGTAQSARDAGAEVLERFDEIRRGKGFALEFGKWHLRETPPTPSVVVVVDADCRLHAGALDRIVADAEQYQRPIQAVYSFTDRLDASASEQISSFALLIKNKVRPLGLQQIGMPCLLTGTGMAFPWKLIEPAELGTGNIVEDMKLGVDLSLAGYPPRLAPGAVVTAEAAPNKSATIKQRTRWEHGHMHTLLSQCPRLFVKGLLRGRLSLIFNAIELGIPPVSLLLVGWAVYSLTCLIWWQFAQGSGVPLFILVGSFGLNLLLLPIVWFKFGRGVVRGKTLLRVPLYILWKLPIYFKLLFSPQKKWIRTDRRSV